MRYRKHSARRGELMVELIGACALMLFVVALVGQVVVGRQRARRSLELWQRARLAADSAMESITSIPYDQLNSESARAAALKALELWNMEQVRVDVLVEAGPPAGKRIELLMDAPPDASGTPRQVRLTAWRYAGTEQESDAR